MSTGGAILVEIPVLPGEDVKAPIIDKVSSPNLMESPGFNSNYNFIVASTKAPPDS